MLFWKKNIDPVTYPHVIYRAYLPAWVMKTADEVERDQDVRLTDDCLVFENNHPVTLRVFLIVFCSLGAAFTFWAMIPPKTSQEDYPFWLMGIYYLFFLSLFLLCAANLVRELLNRDKSVVFNRTDGTVTMPAGFLNLENERVTVPFDQVELLSNAYRGIGRVHVSPPYRYRIPGMNGFSGARFVTSYRTVEAFDFNYFALLTLYMDRNRPLPDGALFDPFRPADEARRKAAGNPPPLYQIVEWKG